jgi:phosphoglucomutase/phosphomannomutase
MLMAEMAAKAKAAGQSLHEKLESLWWQFGYHAEHTVNLFMEGSEGMSRMMKLMRLLREQPPHSLAGLEVSSVRDYKMLTMTYASGRREALDAPQAEMIILDLSAEGNYVAVRPSGTEPKVKFYVFTYVPAERIHDLGAVRGAMSERIARVGSDLRQVADSV